MYSIYFEYSIYPDDQFLHVLDVMITHLISGADAVEAQCKRFEVRASDSGKILFSADEDEIVIGADRLKVTGMVIIKNLNACKHIFK